MADYKDVYETGDLPEADQDFEEDIKDCVEKLNINANTAFNRFKGKEILINDQKKIIKNVSQVNPFEKAKKLLASLDSLAKEIENNGQTDQNEPVTKDQLLMLIEGLTLQVKELNIEKNFGSEANFEVNDPNKALYKKFVNHKIEPWQKPTKSENRSYLLTNHVEVTDHINQMKLANLTKRLDVLDKLVGDDNVKLANIVADCPNKGIAEAVERLTAKTGLLNTAQLDIVEARLGAVSNRLKNLETVAASGSSLDQESQQKIAGLYELVKKWDHVVDAVPGMIDQCVSMQDFHSKSVKLGQSITWLDNRHREMCFRQQACQMALKNMENSIAPNFETFRKNVVMIDEKLQKLN